MLKLKAKMGSVRLYDLSEIISYARWEKVDEKKALKSKDLLKNKHKLYIQTDNENLKKYLGIKKNTKSNTTITTKTKNVVISEQNNIFVAQVQEEVTAKGTDKSKKIVSPNIVDTTNEEVKVAYEPKKDIIVTGEDITANNLINEIKAPISKTTDVVLNKDGTPRKKPGRKPKEKVNEAPKEQPTETVVKKRKTKQADIIVNEDVSSLSGLLNSIK